MLIDPLVPELTGICAFRQQDSIPNETKLGQVLDGGSHETDNKGAEIEKLQHQLRQTTSGDPNYPKLARQLGTALLLRYRSSGDMKDLDATVQNYQEAVNHTAKDDPDRAGQLYNLAVSFGDRYRRLGDLRDIEAAIQHFQDVVDLTAKGHSDRAGRLESLGMAYMDRFMRLGDLADLGAALQHLQEAVNFTAEGQPDRVRRIYSLAVSIGTQYQRLGDLKTLETAIQHFQDAVNLTGKDDPDRARRLDGLAVSLEDRYRRLGDLPDLKAALQYKQEAVNLIAKDHPERAQQVQSLAISFHSLFWRLGDLADLEVAMQHYQEAVSLTAKGDPEMARRLHSLAAGFRDRYERQGHLTDLEAAVQHFQEAVDLTPKDHPDRAERLQGFAISLGNRYERLGDLIDLETAMQNFQQAVKLTAEDDPDRAERLEGLALFFSNRYQRLGDLTDLKAAMQYFKESVDLTAKDNPDWPGRLRRYSVLFSYRYERLGDLTDLETAIQYDQEAVNLTPKDHPDRAERLHSLAISFGDRYRRLQHVTDLEAAIQYDQEAINFTAKDDPDRAGQLESLGLSFEDRYKRVGDLTDLEAAIQYKQESVDLTGKDHPDIAWRLHSLAISVGDRYRKLGNLTDLKAVHEHYKTSLSINSAAPETLWRSSLGWASFAAEFEPTYCITAYIAAFNLLPELLWMGHSIPVRQDLIRRLNLPGTTSVAVRTCINISSLSSIIEILEQGLGTIFQQMLQLRTAVDDLPYEQAQKFKELSMKLYSEGSDDSMTIVNQRNVLIHDIRKQPRFEHFLQPRPYSVLCQASQNGPVIILNSDKKTCHGIIILNPASNPVHVAFDNVTLDLLQSHQIVLKRLSHNRARARSASTRLFGYQEGLSSPTKSFKDMLTWLWIHIVEPVYKILESHSINGGRLWWLPTGAFTGLPLHACPRGDQFIHSYTATLESLLEAYSKPSSRVNKLGVIGVTQTDSKGANYLEGVGQEVVTILSIVQKSFVTCAEGEQATVDAVKTQLQNCSWIHLACHGMQNHIQPTKSHLLLYDGDLELETILRLPLENAEVVFLAACQTAMGDSELVNESFHLGGGFIAAGFRGSIGTLWSMDDRDGPMVARILYSYLFGNGRQPQATDAAVALHLAVKELRKRNVPYERWVPFIHMGV
ncbi:CHAT domain-containing protein [Mycena pura]|uniref:CHAT domain-containing protein n=1 Tax=Mycena pura TaxID=153505 RepID=A0AAD6YJC0_9AGAR|nr:CHAT domain-containing protein [Mycena pura]